MQPISSGSVVPLPADFLRALRDSQSDEVLVTSREGASRGTVPTWFLIAPPGVVYLFTFAFSTKARRWQKDPWVRLTIPDGNRASATGEVHFVNADEIDDDLAELIVERWAMQGATTVPGLRRTLRDGVHALLRVEAT